MNAPQYLFNILVCNMKLFNSLLKTRAVILFTVRNEISRVLGLQELRHFIYKTYTIEYKEASAFRVVTLLVLCMEFILVIVTDMFQTFKYLQFL